MIRIPPAVHERDCVEAAVWLMLLSKSPSPETVRAADTRGTGQLGSATPTTSPRKRRGSTRDAGASTGVRKRLCADFSDSDDSVLGAPPTPGSVPRVAPRDAGDGSRGGRRADFMIHGSQGALAVCERKAVVRDGMVHPYMLVRLRGQSNTLPHDARLSVSFDTPQPQQYVDIHIARVRIKAGVLKYDFLPDTCRLPACPAGSMRTTFAAPLLSSIFSKKCWAGVVVRGPRMFVAFTRINGRLECHSAPMFVEISPTSTSPSYRDPVLEYSDDLLASFFAKSTFSKLGRLYTASSQAQAVE